MFNLGGPDDPGEKRMVGIVVMDPVMRIAEVVARALVICKNNGTMTEAQIHKFYKAMRQGMADLDNELLDIQVAVQAQLDAGEEPSIPDGEIIPINKSNDWKSTHTPTSKRKN